MGCPKCGFENPLGAKFCTECGTRLIAAAAAAGTSPERTIGSQALAERRQLTIMFYDLVGSTAVATRLDPEEVRELIGAFHRCVRDEVTRYGGMVARYVGDGGLIYFGYPQAHEDDAARSIHAGLAAIEAVGKLVMVGDFKPQIRIGVATGIVVVGDIVGGNAVPEQDIVGQAPNLAARLQSEAAPGTIVVCAATRRLAGPLFEYADLGALTLKGFPEPSRAWSVLGTAQAETQFDARRRGGLAALVGREPEIDTLRRLWGRAREGSGQVVTLSGEPGIGKSRLCEMLLTSLEDEPHTRLRFFCSTLRQASPFYPSIRQLERAAGFARGDSAADRLRKLEATLVPGERHAESVALFANLLSIPLDDASRYPELPANPMQRREKTLAALLEQLRLLARQRPVVAVFEDAHWVDPTSLELLNRTAAMVARNPVLLIVTCRPEFKPPWPAAAHVSAISLSPLSLRQGTALIEQVAAGQVLEPDLVADIVARADGVPLFLEELTKAVLEARQQGSAGKSAPAEAQSVRTDVPATLQASLLARLDRLGPAKEIAQVGAAIGREFSHELLAAVTPTDQAKLGQSLHSLIAAGLISQRGAGPSATFLFKHVLIQDAAYSTLLRATRQGMHRRIAEALEANFPDAVALHPELLAHHCNVAGLAEKAVDYWLKAGQQALARSAMAEAIGRLQQGLAILARMKESAWRNERELQLQITLGKALIATRGHAAPVTGEAFARARELCELLQRPPAFVSVLHGQWTHSLLRAELSMARQRARELLESGEAKGDPVWILMGCRSSGVTCFPVGDFAAGRAFLDRGLALFDPGQRALYAGLTVDDVQVVMLYYSAWQTLYLGDIGQARARCRAALDVARQLGQPFSLAHVLIASTLIELILQSYDDALVPLREVEVLAKEQGIQYFGAIAAIFRGRHLAAHGQAREGVEHINRGIAFLRASGNVLYLPSFLTTLAEAHSRAGDHGQAMIELAEAGRIAEATGTRNDEAEIHRARGEVLLELGQTADAEQSFRQALAVAQRHKARLWELRATVALATLLQRQGLSGNARDILLPACGGWSEGGDSPPLREARALLEALA